MAADFVAVSNNNRITKPKNERKKEKIAPDVRVSEVAGTDQWLNRR